MEHVEDLDLAFAEILRVLKPGGVFLSRFGPLFYSPQGYHLYWACQVPYAHLVFGLDAILERREARSGTTMSAASWSDMGLNQKRFVHYERAVRRAGFEILRLDAIPVRGMTTMARVPLVRDLLIFGIDCKLRRPLRRAWRPQDPGAQTRSV